MKKFLIAYFSRTGRTQKMAAYIAEGIRSTENSADLRQIADIPDERALEGYDGYLFGCPTYLRDMTDGMKTFLFMVQKAPLEGKIGGAFGSYTHIGDAPQRIHDTMEYAFKMNMAGLGSLLVKEQILDSGKGAQPCMAYGQTVARTATG